MVYTYKVKAPVVLLLVYVTTLIVAFSFHTRGGEGAGAELSFLVIRDRT